MRKIALLILIACCARGVAAQCTPCEDVPTSTGAAAYRIALKYRNTEGTLVIHISSRAIQFNKDALLKLACKLHHDFKKESDLFVLVFDDNKAARRYQDPGTQHRDANWKTYAKSFKAFYARKPAAKKHWIVWDFDPLVTFSDGEKYAAADLCLSP